MGHSKNKKNTNKRNNGKKDGGKVLTDEEKAAAAAAKAAAADARAAAKAAADARAAEVLAATLQKKPMFPLESMLTYIGDIAKHVNENPNRVYFMISRRISNDGYRDIRAEIERSNDVNGRNDEIYNPRVDVDVDRFPSLTLRRSDAQHFVG